MWLRPARKRGSDAAGDERGDAPADRISRDGEVRIAGLCDVLARGATEEGGNGRSYEVVVLAEGGTLEAVDPDLVMIDATSTAHLFELLETFRRLRPRIRLVVLADNSDAPFVERAIESGARGVLNHAATERELRMAVEVVLDGSVWAPRRVLSRLLDRAHTVSAVPVQLTGREREAIRHLVRGLSNREIGREMGVEAATVKAHLGRLMRKAGVTNRTALGVHATASRWDEKVAEGGVRGEKDGSLGL